MVLNFLKSGRKILRYGRHAASLWAQVKRKAKMEILDGTELTQCSAKSTSRLFIFLKKTDDFWKSLDMIAFQMVLRMPSCRLNISLWQTIGLSKAYQTWLQRRLSVRISALKSYCVILCMLLFMTLYMT